MDGENTVSILEEIKIRYRDVLSSDITQFPYNGGA